MIDSNLIKVFNWYDEISKLNMLIRVLPKPTQFFVYCVNLGFTIIPLTHDYFSFETVRQNLEEVKIRCETDFIRTF
jgi:hypothetical protein